ncbi:hypothetical protein YC2023_101383 [Brassica napus]
MEISGLVKSTIATRSIFVLQNRAQLVFVHALSWGRQTAEPLKKVHENGFFEMNKLIIKVEVKIVQAFDERDVSGREMVDSNVCMEEIGNFREAPRSGHISVARASLDQSVLTRNS